MLWRATVQREDPAKPIGFSPKEQQAQAGDAIFWFNEDANETHQPVPDEGIWRIPLIAPGTSSQQLSLGSAGTYSYRCSYHDGETASIIVSNAILIAAGASPLFGDTTIAPGQCVSWGNSDAEPHQPCPDTGQAWLENPVGSGDLSAPVSFADSGSFSYHCAIHPENKSETGTITVKQS